MQPFCLQRGARVDGGKHAFQCVDITFHIDLCRRLNHRFVQKRAGIFGDVFQQTDDRVVLLVILIERLVGILAERDQLVESVRERRVDQRYGSRNAQ